MTNKIMEKILIIRLSALGDTIHTLPLASALRKKYPNVQLDWIVEDKAEKFIINNPLLNNVYVLPKKKWKKNKKLSNLKEFFEIIKRIRKEQYDVVIDTQQLLKSSVIMALSGAKRKIALDDGREFSWLFANEIIKTGRKQFDLNYHVVNRNLEIAKYLDCQNIQPEFILPDLSGEYAENIVNIVDNLDKERRTIVIAPATTWTNKHWTVKGWVDVINEFKDKCNIIVTAANNEKKLTSEILSQISGGNIIDLSGQTTLSDLVCIFKSSDLVISPDSGSAHIAWACGNSKIITLFFATSSLRTAPFGERYFSISSKEMCSPCMKKYCRLKNDKNKCIQSIKSDEIINIVNKVLK